MSPSPAGHRPPQPRRAARRVRDTVALLAALVQAVAAAAALAALLAGLPWALAHYLGWPLPRHVPTPDQVTAVLLGPLSDSLLLDILACLCWITWAAFVIDVARVVIDAARGARWPAPRPRGPLHTTAAILVGVIVLSVLGTRTATAATGGGPTGSGHQPVVATAPTPHPTDAPPLTITGSAPGTPSGPDTAGAAARVVTVREPDHGIHDTLSRIAQRSLHDPARWPEIFTLNHGHPQPHGHRLTNPNLIYPGEQLLLPPNPPAQPPAPAPRPGNQHQPPPAPTTTPAPTATRGPAPGPSTPGQRLPDVEWSAQVYLGAAVAAAISAAVVLARHRHRRAYQPGSGRRDDLPVAPLVYQLRLAHLRQHGPDTHTGTGTGTDIGTGTGAVSGTGESTGGHDRPGPADADPTPAVGTEVETAPGLGVREGQQVALDLARARGLGLAGPGAAAALRAVLLTLLAPTPAACSAAGGVRVIVPAEDLAALLGPQHPAENCPAGLRVLADLDTAVDELDTTITTRAHHPDRAWPLVVLVARVPTRDTARLQAVLDNGAGLGVLGVLLGQWRSGASAYVRADATVSATSPGPAQTLLGARLFHLPAPGTADLLALLHDAHPTPADQHTGGQPGNGADPIDLEVTAIAPPADPDPRPATNTPPAAAIPADAETDTRPPEHTGPPLSITVLGTPRIWWAPPRAATGQSTPAPRDITTALAPRQRELLVFVALHPAGVSRDTLIACFWDETDPARSTNALNTALTRLRRTLEAATQGTISNLVLTGDGHYRLNPDLATVDYWQFADAITARRDARTDTHRIAADHRIVTTYHGPLAEGIDTDWIIPVREATRRDALDAVAALARALIDQDPQHTLDLLETARAFDPHNELLYRDIMRIQHRLGRLDAIPRTLALLTTRLAEIDEHPTPHAHQLATHLQHTPQPPAHP